MSTTVTAASTAVGAGHGMMPSLVLILTLIGLLVAREMSTAREGAPAARWGRVLNVGIVPLLISFAFIVVVQVISFVK